MDNLTSTLATSWLFSEDHWFNTAPRSAHLLRVPSWLQATAKPFAVPNPDESAPMMVQFLTAELWTMFELHRIPTDQSARKPNKVTVAKVIRTVAFQHVIQCLTALSLVILTRPENVLDWKMESPAMVVLKLFIASLLLDTYQYWLHYLMHVNRTLYRTFHIVHHELTVPFAFGALYNHPFEGFLLDTVGGAIPSLILNMHPWTSALFYSIATLKTVDDHCGYAWAWSPGVLFNSNGAAYHDIHHWGKGRMYNFAQPFYTFWDHAMGTEYESAMARKKLRRQQEDKADVTTTDDSDASTVVNEKRSVSAGVSPRKPAAGRPSLRLRKEMTENSSDDGTQAVTEEEVSSSDVSVSPVRSSKRVAENKKSK
ncbi:hypothetical protein HDU98_009760 [Podochytrium sp. JEL0797]|nr:hypothetical protein HDU98_009760 [Podochytrium sp. JEL0797]